MDNQNIDIKNTSKLINLPKITYECCDGCGIISSNNDEIINLECECCNNEDKNVNICINCIEKYKIIGFEYCKNKYPKIFKYINSVKNITDNSKIYSYSKQELDTIKKDLLYKNKNNSNLLNYSLLYKKINDYDDLNQNIYSYSKLNYERDEIFEIDDIGLYIFNFFYCKKCIKNKCVFFCPLHNIMTIDNNKNNKEIVNINTINLNLDDNDNDNNNSKTLLYKCPYVHKILDIFVYEV